MNTFAQRVAEILSRSTAACSGALKITFPLGIPISAQSGGTLASDFCKTIPLIVPFHMRWEKFVVAAAAPGTACNPVGSAPDLSNDTVHFRNLAGSGSVPISMKLHPCPMGRLVVRVVVRGDARGCLGTLLAGLSSLMCRRFRYSRRNFSISPLQFSVQEDPIGRRELLQVSPSSSAAVDRVRVDNLALG